MCSAMGFTNWKSRICRGCSHMCPEISGTAVAQMFSPGEPVGIHLCLGFSFWPHWACEELQESARNQNVGMCHIAALLASSSAGLLWGEIKSWGWGKRPVSRFQVVQGYPDGSRGGGRSSNTFQYKPPQGGSRWGPGWNIRGWRDQAK